MEFWDSGIMAVTGCTKVSLGCKNCWSERAHVMRSKNPRMHNCYAPSSLTAGKFNGKVKFNLRLLEAAAKRKEPTIYAIWNDLYHEGLTIEQIGQAHRIMANTKHSHHTFLIVTKRAERAAAYCGDVSALSGGISLPSNIWHIVTTENQAMADNRIPHLLQIPGKRGIIIEPMLEAIGIDIPYGQGVGDLMIENIHQVILGPENGPGKRPFDPAWADSVRAQCEAAGVPFYRKDTEEGQLAWRKS